MATIPAFADAWMSPARHALEKEANARYLASDACKQAQARLAKWFKDHPLKGEI